MIRSRIDVRAVWTPERAVRIRVQENGEEESTILLTSEVARKFADMIVSASNVLDAMGGASEALIRDCKVDDVTRQMS